MCVEFHFHLWHSSNIYCILEDEAEAHRLEEEAKQEKKRLKLEEKERKRQEFLSRKQQNVQSTKSREGDAGGKYITPKIGFRLLIYQVKS